jgi:hypothetical protein
MVDELPSYDSFEPLVVSNVEQPLMTSKLRFLRDGTGVVCIDS